MATSFSHAALALAVLACGCAGPSSGEFEALRIMSPNHVHKGVIQVVGVDAASRSTVSGAVWEAVRKEFRSARRNGAVVVTGFEQVGDRGDTQARLIVGLRRTPDALFADAVVDVCRLNRSGVWVSVYDGDLARELLHVLASRVGGDVVVPPH